LIVLDTHVWVWWLAKPQRMAKKCARTIERASRIGVPSICAWEVAMKAHTGRLKFDRPYDIWIEEALTQDSRIELLPLLPRIAIEAVQLSWDHPDPADRFIVATARVHGAPLMTSDARMHDSRLVCCVWS
jgi:PIN domain nuclease of toxin-antitoxin system